MYWADAGHGRGPYLLVSHDRRDLVEHGGALSRPTMRRVDDALRVALAL